MRSRLLMRSGTIRLWIVSWIYHLCVFWGQMQRYSSFFFCLIFYCIILVCCVCLLVFTFFIVIFQLKFSKDPLEEIILLFVEKNVFLISLYIYIRISNWQNLTHLRIVVSNVWKIAYFYTELPTSKRCVPLKLHSKPRKSELM